MYISPSKTASHTSSTPESVRIFLSFFPTLLVSFPSQMLSYITISGFSPRGDYSLPALSLSLTRLGLDRNCNPMPLSSVRRSVHDLGLLVSVSPCLRCWDGWNRLRHSPLSLPGIPPSRVAEKKNSKQGYSLARLTHRSAKATESESDKHFSRNVPSTLPYPHHLRVQLQDPSPSLV